eukprot:11354972-Alexandrium_andersonii.AAC.1
MRAGVAAWARARRACFSRSRHCRRGALRALDQALSPTLDGVAGAEFPGIVHAVRARSEFAGPTCGVRLAGIMRGAQAARAVASLRRKARHALQVRSRRAPFAAHFACRPRALLAFPSRRACGAAFSHCA